MNSKITVDVQNQYSKDDSAVRAHFGTNQEDAENYYRRYVNFIRQNVDQKNAMLLEIGCGSGWSTLMLKKVGFAVHGLDLHPGPLESNHIDPEIKYSQGDSQKIPFESNSFDVISMHDVLEHVPEPQLALSECLRVLRPGGRLIVVGPNLLSFLSNLYFTLIVTFQKISNGKIFERRTPMMPRHPGGNTVIEAWYCTAHHLFFTLKKLFFEKEPIYLMRVPDNNPPFFADNDACYFLNPIDLKNWSKKNEHTVLIKWFSSHRAISKLLWPFLGGTWIVIQKR